MNWQIHNNNTSITTTSGSTACARSECCSVENPARPSQTSVRARQQQDEDEIRESFCTVAAAALPARSSASNSNRSLALAMRSTIRLIAHYVEDLFFCYPDPSVLPERSEKILAKWNVKSLLLQEIPFFFSLQKWNEMNWDCLSPQFLLRPSLNAGLRDASILLLVLAFPLWI